MRRAYDKIDSFLKAINKFSTSKENVARQINNELDITMI